MFAIFKKYRKLFIVFIIILLCLNLYFSSKAIKECVYDYLNDCERFWYCKWSIYDLAYYNGWEQIWHIVHEKNDTFSADKNIPKMKVNNVNGCLYLTSNYMLNISWTVQCVDVWLFKKLNNLIIHWK